MNIDLILIAAAVIVGIAYFAVRNKRMQSEVKKRLD